MRSPVVRPSRAAAPAAGPRLIDELRRALDENELCLHYQPIVEPTTGEIAGAEALLRWQHPERGLLGPAEFLDEADRSGLTLDIAAWVAETAIAECAAWPSSWFVSINLSPRQLVLGTAAGLRDLFAGLCRRHGVAPGRLWVELTEQGGFESGRIAPILDELADLGVQIAIDDFGNGDASLGRLRVLPFHAAKLDRSLLWDVDGPTATVILKLSMELAHACGARVVAEGVETREQLVLVRELGCDLVQGFHLARPVPPDELRRLAGGELGAPPATSHRLALYDDHVELDRLIADLAVGALRRDGAVLVIARPDRLNALAETVTAGGLSLERLRAERRLLEFDAEQLLDAILVDGRPDEGVLAALVAEMHRRVAPTTGRLRICSEMAAVLWERGETDAALELETLHERLTGLPPHVLLCPHPTSAFERGGGSLGFRDLQARHDRTLPSAAGLAAAASTGLAETALLHHEVEMVRKATAPFQRERTGVGA